MAFYYGKCPTVNDFNPRLVKKVVPGPMAETLIETSYGDTKKVSSLIHETMPQLEVKKIRTVQNNFLEAMYLLKKEEYKSRRRGKVQEMLLFHVTSASNVNSIISNNFDWRKVRRGKFGLGTSFSGNAGYANRYANDKIGEERAIIVAKVLVSSTIGGKERLKIPHHKYDTATGNGGNVYVKFSDNEALPKYVVYYNANVCKTIMNNRMKHNENGEFYGMNQAYRPLGMQRNAIRMNQAPGGMGMQRNAVYANQASRGMGIQSNAANLNQASGRLGIQRNAVYANQASGGLGMQRNIAQINQTSRGFGMERNTANINQASSGLRTQRNARLENRAPVGIGIEEVVSTIIGGIGRMMRLIFD